MVSFPKSSPITAFVEHSSPEVPSSFVFERIKLTAISRLFLSARFFLRISSEFTFYCVKKVSTNKFYSSRLRISLTSKCFSNRFCSTDGGVEKMKIHSAFDPIWMVCLRKQIHYYVSVLTKHIGSCPCGIWSRS